MNIGGKPNLPGVTVRSRSGLPDPSLTIKIATMNRREFGAAVFGSALVGGLSARSSGLRAQGSGLRVNGPRLNGRLLELSKFGANPQGGVSRTGYSDADIPEMIQGTLPQSRITKLSPRPAGDVELGELFRNSMQLW